MMGWDDMVRVPMWWWALLMFTMTALIMRVLYLMGFTVRQPHNVPAVIPPQHQPPLTPVTVTPPPAPLVEVIDRETITRERITRPIAPNQTGRKDIVVW